jgi:Methylmalonyl-CoA mutase, C-terminal domain/subunit (cobalamin-binding)
MRPTGPNPGPATGSLILGRPVGNERTDGIVVMKFGGTSVPQDYDELKRAGAEAIFPPGTVIAEAAAALLDKLNQRLGHGREAAE